MSRGKKRKTSEEVNNEKRRRLHQLSRQNESKSSDNEANFSIPSSVQRQRYAQILSRWRSPRMPAHYRSESESEGENNETTLREICVKREKNVAV